MPRNALAKTNLPTKYATTPTLVTWEAADVANGNDFTLTGDEVLLVRNVSADTPYTVTVTSAADERGRLGHITAFEVDFGEMFVFQRFAQLGWRQSDGKLWISGSNASIEFAVLNLATSV